MPDADYWSKKYGECRTENYRLSDVLIECQQRTKQAEQQLAVMTETVKTFQKIISSEGKR